MQRNDLDWKELRGSVIILAVCLTLGGTLLYGSHYFQKQMKQEFIKNNTRFQSISQRYLAVDEEERLINEYFPEFIELYNNGVIGKEQRLNWIEVLRTTSKDMKLPKLSYQIESQNAYTPSYSVNTGKFKLYSSKMNLEMNLLHEGDLFSVFQTLNEEANGIYSPSRCTLKSSGRIEEKPQASNVTASCELQWYTIKMADGSEIKI